MAHSRAARKQAAAVRCTVPASGSCRSGDAGGWVLCSDQGCDAGAVEGDLIKLTISLRTRSKSEMDECFCCQEEVEGGGVERVL